MPTVTLCVSRTIDPDQFARRRQAVVMRRQVLCHKGDCKMTQQLPSAPKVGMPSGFADFDRFFNRMMRGWPLGWPEMASTSEPRALRAFEHAPNVEVKENGKSYTVSV